MESTTQHGWAESRPEYAGEGVSLQRAMVKIPWYRPIMREDYRADERTLEVAATIQAQDQGLWAQSRPEFSGGVIRPLVRVPRYPHVKWKFSTPRDPAYQKMATRLALQVGPALTTSIDILCGVHTSQSCPNHSHCKVRDEEKAKQDSTPVGVAMG